MQRRASLGFVVALSVASCGGGNAAMAPPAAEPPSSPPPAPPVDDCSRARPGTSPLRRLTSVEYNNTVRDLLGDDSRPADAFPAEELGNGFGNDAASQSISRLHVERYREAAETLAERATVPARLAALLRCDPLGEGEDACARTFITEFGGRAHRRPLSPDSHERLAALFTRTRDRDGFAAGIRAVVAAMLQAPAFLYRLEPPPEGQTRGPRALDGWKRASRLSYLLWASMPDPALFEAARNGELATAPGVRRQAERLLASPRARPAVSGFFAQWLGFQVSLVEKDDKVFPRLRPTREAGIDLGRLLGEESTRFVEHLVFDDAADVTTLLTARYTFWNQPLAAFYGASDLTLTDWQRVTLDGRTRAGILTHASVLASRTPGTLTNPTRRGVFVRRLLCAPIPEPPQGFDLLPPPPSAALTTRELFAAHAASPACRPCHQTPGSDRRGLRDLRRRGAVAGPRKRPADRRQRLDPRHRRGRQLQRPDSSLPTGWRAATILRRCLVGHCFTFAYGRAESEQDAGTRAALEAALLGPGGNLRALLLALTQTDAFLCGGEAS